MKIFDNSNLAESYSGVTTPLTFSFARYVYQEVYKNFCRMMGADKKAIAAHADIFPEMVVCIGGRMYYDLANWYRLISFLPGYSFNKGFFEEMLGVNKAASFEKEISKSFFVRWFFYFQKTLWQTLKIFASFLFMGFLVKRFNSNFDSIYGYYNKKDLSQEDEQSLKDVFLRLTNKLVVRWRVPITNDFAVMVSTGIVRKLFKKWLPEKNSYTFLYMGSALPLISFDPGLMIADIAEAIKNNEEFTTLFNAHNTSEDILAILKKKHREHEISKKIFAYIKKYGDRMPGELKLESKCLNEYPEIFIQIITNAVNNNRFLLRKDIRRATVKNCGLGMLKRFTVSFFLDWAKRSIRMREETRFKRTLIFGFARKIFIELGKKYKERNLIHCIDDIFYLTLDEILESSPADPAQFKLIIQKRKTSLAAWKAIELPRRIETALSVNDFERAYMTKREKRNHTSKTLKGVVVSTGGVEHISEEALVMKEFDPSANFNGKIIITSHTDPGWSLVFPFIKGLVVERGGMLSHAAIVARELDIPCIVGVEHATSSIVSTERIELDLKSGEITKI